VVRAIKARVPGLPGEAARRARGRSLDAIDQGSPAVRDAAERQLPKIETPAEPPAER
jgi:hypothetical protein